MRQNGVLFFASPDRAEIGVGQFAFYSLSLPTTTAPTGSGVIPVVSSTGSPFTSKAVNCFELNWAAGKLDLGDYNVTGFRTYTGLVIASQVTNGDGSAVWAIDKALTPVLDCSEP